MSLFTLAFKNLWRRPARSILTALGLAVAIAAVVALVGLSQSLESSFLDLYSSRGTDLVVQRKGGAVQLSKGIDVAFAERVRKLPGVREVTGGLMDMIAFEDQNLFAVLVNGWEPDSPVLDRVRVIDGRRLQTGDDRAVMLGRILAANLDKKVGDPLKVYGRDFHVVGIFESISVYENGAVFMLLADLQREMDRPHQVTGFVVHCLDRSPESVAAMRKQIEALDPAVSAQPSAEFVESLSQMKLTRTMSWTMSLVAIVIGAIGVLNTMAMSVFERRGEIAAFRAMGWRKSRVLRLILSEALILSLGGAAVGIALGVAAVVSLAHLRATSGLVAGVVSPRSIVEGILIATLMALIGAAIPAYRCSRRPIAEAMRSA